MERRKNMDARDVALYGLLIALAFVLSYVESLIPISLGVPGVKLGLANLAVIAALYTVGAGGAAFISLVRIVLMGFTFGTPSMILYSLAGGILSLLVMAFLKRFKVFGMVGISVAGGAAHNIGQIAVAAAVVEQAALFAYLPVLLAAGTVAGSLCGRWGGRVVRRIRRAISR